MGKMVSLLNAEVVIASDRSRWYDRNPTPVHESAEVVTGPTAPTEAWNYLVPANKVLFVHTMYSEALRETQASALIGAGTNISVNLGAANIAVFATQYRTNTALFGERIAVPGGFILLATHRIIGIYNIADTGGTIRFSLSMAGTLYDA